MTKKFGFSLAFACVLFAGTANAENIGFINDPELAQKSTALQGLQMQFERMKGALQNDIQAEIDNIQNQKKELVGNRSGLSQEELGKEIDEINKTEKDLDTRAQEAFIALRKNYADAIISVKEKAITPIVKELAKEKNFTAILNSANSFYVQEDLDVTQEAIKRVNKKMPMVEMKKVSLKKAEKNTKAENSTKAKKDSKSEKKSKSGKKSK